MYSQVGVGEMVVVDVQSDGVVVVELVVGIVEDWLELDEVVAG